MTVKKIQFGPIIRIIETYFVIVMLCILAYAFISKPGDFHYDISMLRAIAVMSSAAWSIWLIERRSIHARKWIPIFIIVVVILSILDIIWSGEMEKIAPVMGIPTLIIGGILYFAGSIFIICYFLFSNHAKEIFIFAPTHSDQPTSDSHENIYEKRFSWPWWRNLGIYYFVFSIFGHWLEIGFCWLIVLGVVMGDYDFSHAQLWDWWLCPYPAEGLAVVLIAAVLAPFKEWLFEKFDRRFIPTLIVSFLVNMLVCATIDFTTGITANANYELWDFRGLPFNFMGQILLQNTILYSIVATFFVWVVYPLMAKLLHRISKRMANDIFIALAALYLFLELLYYVNIGPNGIVFG